MEIRQEGTRIQQQYKQEKVNAYRDLVKAHVAATN